MISIDNLIILLNPFASQIYKVENILFEKDYWNLMITTGGDRIMTQSYELSNN